MRRQLSSYSSSSSTSSSPDFYPSLSTDPSYSSACGDGPPPADRPLMFRRNSSMESIARGYESPEEEEEIMDDEAAEQHTTAASASAEQNADGSSSNNNGGGSGALGPIGTVPLRTPRSLAGVPRTIVEDEEQQLQAAALAPIYADLAIARTRSMPLPRHEAAALSSCTSPSAAAAMAAAAAAAATASSNGSSSSSSSSSLPGAQPGFGSSQSWTPGLAPPMPYTHITPLHSPLDDHALYSSSGINSDAAHGHAFNDEEQSDDLPPPTVIAFAPLLPQSIAAVAADAAESDDLPPMFDSSAYAHISRAPPPSRAPSLVRQKGVYIEATSRSFSLPLDYAARLREQQRMAREVQEREEQHQQQILLAAALAPGGGGGGGALPLQPHTPTPPITRYMRRRD